MTTREPRTAGLTSDEADEIERQARTEAAPPSAEAVEALRALVDAVDEQLRPAQAVGGWGDSPLSQAVDEAHRIMAALPTSPPALDAATLERAIYNAGLQLVEAGKYNVAPAVGSILRVVPSTPVSRSSPRSPPRQRRRSHDHPGTPDARQSRCNVCGASTLWSPNAPPACSRNGASSLGCSTPWRPPPTRHRRPPKRHRDGRTDWPRQTCAASRSWRRSNRPSPRQWRRSRDHP